MAIDRRATRLGVLGLVGVILFSALGVRLWFLQTVKAEELQQVTAAAKTRIVRIAPERGRIFDADGRILADNERVLTVAVDWEQLRKKTDRAEIFRRLSAWVDVPVEDMEARFDSDVDSPLPPDAASSGRRRGHGVSAARAHRGLPRRSRSSTEWDRVYPYAPLAVHVVGYMGAITATRPRSSRPARLPAERARRPVRCRAQHGVGAARHVGQAGLRGRRCQPAGAAARRGAADQRHRHPALDRPRAAAVRRAGARDHAGRPPQPDRAQPEGQEAERRDREDGSAAARHDAVQGAGRLGDHHELHDRRDPRDGELPDVRQPLVRGRAVEQEVLRDLPVEEPRRHRDRPRPVDPRQPRHPGPLQPRLDVQAVHRVRRDGQRPASTANTYYNDTGIYRLQSGVEPGRRATPG